MPFINITKPNAGDGTRKAFADAVIDNLNFLNGIISGLSGQVVPNGSFEDDADSSGVPDNWQETLFTGGSFEITGDSLSDTEHQHGARAVKFVHPGGAGNGGGYIETSDFLDVSPLGWFFLRFQIKSTAAGIRNKAEVRWYDGNQSFISTTTGFSSIDAPNVWSLQTVAIKPPAGARFAKVRLIGGEDSATVAGTTYFDDVSISQRLFRRSLEFAPKAGQGSQVFQGERRFWKCPPGVNLVWVEVLAGGGGGRGGFETQGSGGGAGGYCAGPVDVIPGNLYEFTVGRGGIGGLNSGGDGEASNFNNALVANPGIGATLVVSGGAGGTASGGMVNVAGNAGTGKIGTNGGDGGDNPEFGFYGRGGNTGTFPGERDGYNADLGGGGGGADGAGGANTYGGDAGDGFVRISW